MECLVFISPILCFIYILFSSLSVSFSLFSVCLLFFLLSLFHILQINSRVAFIINLNLYFLTLSLSLPLFYPLHDSPLPSPINKFITVHCVHCHRLTFPPPFPLSPQRTFFFPTMTTTFFLDYLQASLGCSLYSLTVEKKEKMNIRYTVTLYPFISRTIHHQQQQQHS